MLKIITYEIKKNEEKKIIIIKTDKNYKHDIIKHDPKVKRNI